MLTVHPPVRAVLFDLDDTLNDRSRSWMAFVELLAHPVNGRLHPCVAEDVHRLVLAADRGGYRPKEELFADLRDQLPWRTRPNAGEIEQHWREHFPRCMVPATSAIELLESLRTRGIRLGIVTNGRAATQNAKIDALKMRSRVDSVVISETVGFAKPDPRIFECALNALGVEAAETLFVGDNPERDIGGPAKMGMRTVWLQLGRTWPEALARPDHTIGALYQLDAILASR